MRKNLLIIDRSGMTHYLRKEGCSAFDRSLYRVVVITNATKACSFNTQFYDDIYIWDTDNDESGLIDFAMQLHQTTPFTRVIAFSERLLLPAAQIRQLIGCKGDRYNDVIGFRDKHAMHRIAKEFSLKVPNQWLASEYQNCLPVVEKHLKLIIKPRSGMGSRGIWIVDNKSMLHQLMADIQSQGEDLDHYVIETYIEGSVFHVDSVIANGNVIFEVTFEYLTPPVQFTDSKPRAAMLVSDPQTAQAIYAANQQVVVAFDIKNGVTHTEFFLTPSGDVIFGEVAKRVGGGVISEAIYQLMGVDLNNALAQSQLGNEITLSHHNELHYGGWLKFHPRPMTINKISDISEFSEDWIKYAIIKKKVGDPLSAPYMTGDSIADFVIAAPNEPLLRSRINSVINTFYCE
ncbi:ATP-grasp domain-containing protein [Zooshikella ganghwensis]|uniref:ATP-grasp domain-containing protein n=1 Tax=Zooshikella ganghwensis TaxID=202772 RepID=A0A4P9VNG4_9GAMM|nr:ATP-grasp domain-containing protein [Zooshikella ganghwensis]RDH43944.1 ATP-grasp domain-containing protein [Zooshikella ganghwensis]